MKTGELGFVKFHYEPLFLSYLANLQVSMKRGSGGRGMNEQTSLLAYTTGCRVDAPKIKHHFALVTLKEYLFS